MNSMMLFSGKLLLVYYFLQAGVKNVFSFKQKTGLLINRKFPLPALLMILTVLFQLCGSLMILLNFYAAFGAVLLILFTFITNFTFCNYWKHLGKDRMLMSFIFYANLAVIGGLLVLMAL